MAISDTKLRTIYGKPYSGPQEVADADGLSVRISPKGVIQFQYRYRWHGKPNRLGLGRLNLSVYVPLVEQTLTGL